MSWDDVVVRKMCSLGSSSFRPPMICKQRSSFCPPTILLFIAFTIESIKRAMFDAMRGKTMKILIA